jgi:glucose/arabinose dehydrogenase
MHINDVGQSTWEEVNLGAAGANYGWPTTEGRFNTQTYPLFTPPRFAYDHGSAAASTSGTFLDGIAIIGATFYNPASASSPFPSAYTGDYFFGDYVGGWIARMDIDHDESVNNFAWVSHGFVDLATGPEGSLYVLGRSVVTRITYP